MSELVEVSRRGRSRRRPRWDAIVGTDHDGRQLSAHDAAVEVLNIVRPTTAVAWFVVFAAHALETWPELRTDLPDRRNVVAFVHELRRWYPFVPALGARARVDQQVGGLIVRSGELVLLDVYGQLHDPQWWERPEEFSPQRFPDGLPDPWTLIPQGGGDMVSGHRCPGEDLTVAILAAIVPRLAQLRFSSRLRGAAISLGRILTLPRGGAVITGVRR